MRNNNLYIVLAILFIILSLVGVYFLVFANKVPNPTANGVVPGFTATATPATEDTDNSDDSTSPTSAPTGSDDIPVATTAPQAPTPTPEYQTYTNTEDGFSVTHRSNRHIYPDTEASGRRYTFYRAAANIAVHVGSSWSWEHPDRNFTSDFTVAGRPTFRYDISSQTIVDITNNTKNYTIQCVHNGASDAKKECEDFLSSFKLL